MSTASARHVQTGSQSDQSHTCVHNPLYLDARVVQLLGKSVHGLQQILAGLRIDVGPPRWDLNCTHRQTYRVSLQSVNSRVCCCFYGL